MAVVPPLPFTPEDQTALRRFLNGYMGCGVVCTSLDKAANTLIVQCPWDYVSRITHDVQNLDVKGTYVVVDRPEDEIVDSHNAFLQAYGLGIRLRYQDMPWYIASAKLHKEDGPDMRFICGSATSSMRIHLVWANRLLNAFLPELDAVFGAVYRNIGADAAWVARSWILKNTAAFIPVLEVWNTQYACYSPSAPLLAASDFARLYTNIPHTDLLDKVMQLTHTVFEMDAHKDHAGIKIREKKHALWLTAVHLLIAKVHVNTAITLHVVDIEASRVCRKAETDRVAAKVFQEALCDFGFSQSLGIALGTETLDELGKEVCHFWFPELNGSSRTYITIQIVPACGYRLVCTSMICITVST